MKGGIQVIIQIEIIMYVIIGFILSTITTGLLLENLKLRQQVRYKMQEMTELEKEMRFKFDLRKKM